MSKKMKIWLMAAAGLVLLGGILFTVVMSILNWDFTGLSTVRYETNTTALAGDIYNITIDADTEDIELVFSEDGECKVECFERVGAKHSVEVTDGALTVKQPKNRSFWNFIGVDFHSAKITLYLPHADYDRLQIASSTGAIEVAKDFRLLEADISVSTGDVYFNALVYGTLKIGSSTGKICVKDTSVGSLDLSVSTGKVELADISCKSLKTDGDTGDLSMKNVVATEKIAINRSTGDVKLEACDAAELSITTDTGDVTGSLLTSKVFITETDTGRVEVPKTATGGKCEITTDTGDIKINIE